MSYGPDVPGARCEFLYWNNVGCTGRCVVPYFSCLFAQIDVKRCRPQVSHNLETSFQITTPRFSPALTCILPVAPWGSVNIYARGCVLLLCAPYSLGLKCFISFPVKIPFVW